MGQLILNSILKDEETWSERNVIVDNDAEDNILEKMGAKIIDTWNQEETVEASRANNEGKAWEIWNSLDRLRAGGKEENNGKLWQDMIANVPKRHGTLKKKRRTSVSLIYPTLYDLILEYREVYRKLHAYAINLKKTPFTYVVYQLPITNYNISRIEEVGTVLVYCMDFKLNKLFSITQQWLCFRIVVQIQVNLRK